MRHWFTLLVLATALGACGDDADARQVLDANDTGIEITVEVGEKFEIRLESNLTTGYAWEVTEQPDVIELVSSDYEAPDTDRDGAGGTEVFIFEGTTEGLGEVRLEYAPSFDDPAVPAETVNYEVQVTGS